MQTNPKPNLDAISEETRPSARLTLWTPQFMKKNLCLLFCLLSLSAHSQLSVQITNTPATLFETFSSARDVVLVKGISEIGHLDGQITFPVDVRVQEVLNVQTAKRVYAVVVRTKMPQQTVINYIDHDEVDLLLAGIRYIVQVDHNVTTPHEHYNASFQTRSGLTVSKYSVDNRNYTAVKTGLADADANVMDLPAIAQLETLIVAAKTKLDALKRGEH